MFSVSVCLCVSVFSFFSVSYFGMAVLRHHRVHAALPGDDQLVGVIQADRVGPFKMETRTLLGAQILNGSWGKAAQDFLNATSVQQPHHRLS